MIVNGGLTLEQEELLTKAHRDIQITGEQFGQVSTMLLGRLAWVGETEAVNVLQELAPRIQQLWVKE